MIEHRPLGTSSHCNPGHHHTAGGAGKAQLVQDGLTAQTEGCWEGFSPQEPAQSGSCVHLEIWHSGGDERGWFRNRRGQGCAGVPDPWDGLGDTQHSQFSPASNTHGKHRAPLAQLHAGAAFNVRSSFRFCCISPTPLGSPCMCRIPGVGWPQLDVWCPPKLLYQCPLQLERGEKIKGGKNTGRDPSLVTITGTTA